MLSVLKSPEITRIPFDIPKGEILDLGYGAIIAQNSLGHFCGYISVPPGHPWHGSPHFPMLNHVICQGGLTYSGSDEETNHWWVGVENVHGGEDMDDTGILQKPFKTMVKALGLYSQESRASDLEYMRLTIILLLSQAYQAHLDGDT